MTDAGTSPNYDVSVVEAVILEIVAELHPEHLSTRTLLLKIVNDPDDAREIGAGVQAIRSLREFGVLADRKDETVQLTPTALRVCALLSQLPPTRPTRRTSAVRVAVKGACARPP